MKILLKSLGYLLFFLCLIIVVLILIPDSQYKSLAEKAIHKLTDRNVVISELKTQKNLNPSLEIKGLSLSNPDWAENTEMITADQLTASLSLIELVKGKLNIDLSSSRLNIELLRDKEGKTNWQFASNEAPVEAQKSSENPSLNSLARFVLKHLNMDDFKLTFKDEQLKSQHELIINSMEVIESQDGIAQSINTKGSFDGLPVTLNGTTGTISELGNSKNMPLDLQATFDTLKLALKGKLDAQSDELNLISDVNLSLPTLDIVTHFTGQKLPADWKDIQGSTKLASKSGQYSLDDIKIKMAGGLNVDIDGSIANLSQLQGVNIDLEAELSSLKGLSIFSPDPLPDLGPLKFNGKINSEKDKFSLNTGKLSYSGEYGDATITGDIGDLIKVGQVNLKTDINLPNLNIAKLFTDAKIPRLGKIKLTSDIVSTEPLDLSANNVKLDYDHDGIKLSSSGSIKSIIKNGGELDLNVEASLNSLSAINSLAETALPVIGPINVSTNLSGKFTKLRVNKTTAELRDEFLTGTINGDIGAIDKLDNIKIKTDLASRSIGDLLNKLGVNSTAKTPAKLTAKIDKLNDDIKISSFNLIMNESKINGDLDLHNILAESKRPKITGKIDVAKFNLDDVLGGKTNGNDSTSASSESSGTAIPDTPLPFNYIRDNDLDLTLNIGEFKTSFITLIDANIKAVAEQGKFMLGPLNTKLNGGDIVLEASIDASANPPKTSIKTKVDGFSFKQAGTFEGSALLDNEGTANASIDLSANGGSVASILANSNGNGFIDIKNLTIKNDLIKFVSGDLVSEATAKLNPLEKKNNTTKINCTAVKLEIKDGLAKAPNGYIADAHAFTITGKAEVNFKDQGLDIEVNTNPKEGLGLGLGEFAKAIKIGGTIAEPKIGLNVEGVAEIGASVGAAIATGGVSLLAQGQLEKLKADSESCAKILQ